MNREQDSRTRQLIGDVGLEKLSCAKVAVIGLGGVGGYAVEALTRAGIGHLTIVDSDTVQITNINRQIIANHQVLGIAKTELFRQRLLEINPDLQLTVHNVFADKSNFPDLLNGCEYLLDAIDSLEAKIDLLEYVYRNDIKTIAVFGAGNRLDPQKIQCKDIAESSGCPLAKRVRKALRDRGISTGIAVVFSNEEPILNAEYASDNLPTAGKRPIGSISYMPAMMGLRAAAEVIRMILG